MLLTFDTAPIRREGAIEGKDGETLKSDRNAGTLRRNCSTTDSTNLLVVTPEVFRNHLHCIRRIHSNSLPSPLTDANKHSTGPAIPVIGAATGLPKPESRHQSRIRQLLSQNNLALH